MLVPLARECAIGIAFAGAALGVRALVDPVVGHHQPYLLVLCAIILSSYLRGSIAAASALLFGLPLCVYFFVDPRYSLRLSGPEEGVNLVSCLAMGTLIMAVTRQRGKARRRAARAERDLQEQAELLQVAAGAARLGVWSWDIATGTVKRSPELERIVGLEPGSADRSRELMATRAIDEDRARIQTAIAESVRTGKDFEVEGRFLRADGVIRWMYSRGRPIVGHSGKVERVVGVGLDVTERKSAEESLRRSDERFRLALSGNAVVVYEQDEHLRYRWVYPPAKEKDVIGRTDADLYGEPYGTRLYELKKRVMESGVAERHEVTVPRNGGLHYYDLIVEPRTGPDGVIRGVIGAATDITPMRIAEAAEASNRKQLDLALSAAHMGIWSWDSRQQRLEWSKEMFALHHVGPGVSALGGTELQEFAESLVHPEDLPPLKAAVARKLERNEDFDLEYRVVIRNEVRWMCTRGQKVDLGAGHYQVLGVVMDITQRKLIDEELTRYRRELEAIIAQRTRALQELRARENSRSASPA